MRRRPGEAYSRVGAYSGPNILPILDNVQPGEWLNRVDVLGQILDESEFYDGSVLVADAGGAEGGSGERAAGGVIVPTCRMLAVFALSGTQGVSVSWFATAARKPRRQ